MPPQILGWLLETIFEKKYGFHDYKWVVEVTVPAGATIRVDLVIPPNEVWLERGYELKVDALGVFELSHHHDGRFQFEDLVIDEPCLSLPYSKFELVENVCSVWIKNTDTVNPHTIFMIAHYRTVPRGIYEKIFAKIEEVAPEILKS